MKEFRGSAVFLVGLYSLLTILTLGGIALFMLGITGTPVRPVVFLLLPLLGLLGWLWSVYFNLPFIILYQEDRTFELKSFFRVLVLAPGEVKGIRNFLGLPWFLRLTHSAGEVVITTQMSDMAELIALLKKENPAAKVAVG